MIDTDKLLARAPRGRHVRIVFRGARGYTCETRRIYPAALDREKLTCERCEYYRRAGVMLYSDGTPRQRDGADLVFYACGRETDEIPWADDGTRDVPVQCGNRAPRCEHYFPADADSYEVTEHADGSLTWSPEPPNPAEDR